MSGFTQRARSLRRSAISLVVLLVLVAALLLAVPGLEDVATRLEGARPSWLVVAVVLEVLSGVGYVLAFQLVFYRAPRVFAARLAWSEQAFQAAVSLGGAAGLGLGAYVLSTLGAPKGRIAERSAVFFLVTSAVNVFVLVLCGAGMAGGILAGPHDLLLGLVPAGVGLLTIVLFLALPGAAGRHGRRLEAHPRVAALSRGMSESIRDARAALFAPDWRMVGAFAYLLFDIAVLWACFRALGADPPVAALVLGYQVGYLANVVPIPGGVGALDAGLVGMLALYGIDPVVAAPAVLAYHAIALWVPTLIGTVAFALLRRQLGRPEPIRAALGFEGYPATSGGSRPVRCRCNAGASTAMTDSDCIEASGSKRTT
jgi:uncharacterized membrane protein YbhN (UPF0104 family)